MMQHEQRGGSGRELPLLFLEEKIKRGVPRLGTDRKEERTWINV